MRRARLLALSVALPAATACAVGPRYQAPRVPMPERWAEAAVPAASPGSTALERWWTSFADAQLDGLMARAIEGNLDLKIAAARIREARAARGIAASASLPQLDVTGSYARLRRSEAVPPFKDAPAVPVSFGPREQNLFEAGFDASWELDIFGGVGHDREAAVAQVQAEIEASRDTLAVLCADVARSYVELRGAQQQVRILEENLRSQRDTLELVKARFTAGLGTELDVARAEGLLETTSAQGPTFERLALTAVHRLAVLLGRPLGSIADELNAVGPIPAAPAEVPSSLPSELLSRRPDLRRAERGVAAATARSGVARADLFPRFAILGAFGRRSDEAGALRSGSSQFWGLMPGFRWPILSGGRLRNNVRVHDARQEQALHQYEKAVLTAVEEVENALASHTRERRRRASLGASRAAHRRALELATERYTGGLESFLSVLDAQRSLFAAEDELVRSDRDVVVSLIALYKALGGGWSLEEPPRAVPAVNGPAETLRAVP